MAIERRFRFGSHDGGFWLGEPGDVVEETGPRIGTRYWLVLDTADKQRWTHVLCRLLETPQEITQASLDASAPENHWRLR